MKKAKISIINYQFSIIMCNFASANAKRKLGNSKFTK